MYKKNTSFFEVRDVPARSAIVCGLHICDDITTRQFYNDQDLLKYVTAYVFCLSFIWYSIPILCFYNKFLHSFTCNVFQWIKHLHECSQAWIHVDLVWGMWSDDRNSRNRKHIAVVGYKRKIMRILSVSGLTNQDRM